MKKIKLLFVFICVEMGMHCPTEAQDSLISYLKVAASNNCLLKSKYLEYQAALEMVPQVGSLPDPEATFGYFIQPKEEIMGNQVADIRVMQMFPWFGTLSAAKSEAAEMAKAKFEEFEAARNKLFFDIKLLYYQLFLLNQEIGYTNENLNILRSLERLSMVSFQAGGNISASNAINAIGATNKQASSMSPSMGGQGKASTGQNTSAMQGSPMGTMPKAKGIIDVWQIQMEIKDLENQLANLTEKLTTMKGSFNRMLSRGVLELIFIPDSLLTESYNDSISLSDSAINANPMVKMYRAEQSSNQSKATKAKKMGYPMVGIGVDYMPLTPRSDVMGPDNGKDMVMPMLTITLPLYRKKYSSMQREAEYLTNASKMKENDARNMLFTEYQNAITDLNDANRRINQYRWQTEIMNKSLNVLLTSYKTNAIGLDEVLQMQQKQFEIKYKLVEAEVNKRNAIATLQYILSELI